jgi:ribosomal protein S18 acetylase RimI-like enzyme
VSELIHDAERILRDCFASFARIPDAAVIDDPAAFGVITALPVGFFSGIAATNIEDDRDIDRIAAIFRARNSPFRWWLTPSTRPRDLEAKLIARNFRHTYDANGMVADLAKVRFDEPPSGLEIRRVANAAEFDDWLDPFCETFEIPERDRPVWRNTYETLGFDDAWTHYAGYVEGKAVSTSSLLMAGNLGGIYCVATIDAARGRGIGRAVTLAAMKDARDRGATRAVLQSSEMGFSVYRALGFEDAGPLRLYDWRPEYER